MARIFLILWDGKVNYTTDYISWEFFRKTYIHSHFVPISRYHERSGYQDWERVVYVKLSGKTNRVKVAWETVIDDTLYHSIGDQVSRSDRFVVGKQSAFSEPLCADEASWCCTQKCWVVDAVQFSTCYNPVKAHFVCQKAKKHENSSYARKSSLESIMLSNPESLPTFTVIIT